MTSVTRQKAAPMMTRGVLKFAAPMQARPRYHANDSTRDILNLETHEVDILDGRALPAPAALDREGFALVRAPTRVTDFRDAAQTSGRYVEEVHALVMRESSADEVVISGGGVLRFAENSAESGKLNNSRPARFIHNDVSERAARMLAAQALGGAESLYAYSSFALFNVWRPFSRPPQNVPLAVLDGRSVAPGDLIAADAVFDQVGKPDWSFEGYLLRRSAGQRWIYYPDMTVAEALIFTTFAYRDGKPFYVPHSGFDDPACPPDAPPRASIEMRAFAFWR